MDSDKTCITTVGYPLGGAKEPVNGLGLLPRVWGWWLWWEHWAAGTGGLEVENRVFD